MDKIVEYILVNKQLNMSIGKTAGQVAHVQTIIDNNIRDLVEYLEGTDFSTTILSKETSDMMKKDIEIVGWYDDWFYFGPQTKVILKAKEKDLLKAIEIGAVEVRDKGLTEIPANSLTAVGFTPQPKSNLVEFTRKFQLL